MERKKEMEIAKEIVQLDLKRDLLLEELMLLIGGNAFELLRRIQNQS
ncbi:hypothetical protein RZN22_11885 [Bacillaceae bacterium S4-13-58]